MHRNLAHRLSALVVSVGVAFALGATALFAAQISPQAAGAKPIPQRGFSIKNGTSAPLRDYRASGPVVPGPSRQVKNRELPAKHALPGTVDGAVQRAPGLSAPDELLQFEAGSDADNEALLGFRVAPPDTNGDVGPNHYVQYINLIVTMYNKSDGSVALGPLPGNAYWEGLGTYCEFNNDGDPIVLYDQFAGRWFATQFGLDFGSNEFHQCIAVSLTDDPTGAYYQYDFIVSTTDINDYPKFGVWPDGYYMTANLFDAGTFNFTGTGLWAFDRAAMLDGNPATFIYFEIPGQGGMLPSDADGVLPPPDGAPNYIVMWNLPPAELWFWQFHADFAVPANSTLTGPVTVPVADFSAPICGNFRGQCVPQLDSPELLEALSDRMMNRLQYRNFGDHESLVTNHSVDVGGGVSGVRWYEIRNPSGAPLGNGGVGGAPEVYQQSTFAPDDGNYRWMGSAAMDTNGNIALGYSVSSSAIYPSIAVTGRLASDPLDTMGAENMFLAGTGSQENTSSRWGDYSSMNIDPVDECTFWYTNEYYETTGNFDWHTRVGAFKFPSCTTGPSGTLEGTVTDGTNPIAGAKVKAGAAQTTTNASGFYSFTLPVDTYDMEVTKYGFFPGFASGVAVTDGGTTTQDFVLAAAPTITVNGVVRDGSGGGWPLYARVQVSGSGYPGSAFWTDPVTGFYSVTLVEGITYTFLINAVSPGYDTGGGPLDLTLVSRNAPFVVRNWDLTVNALACSAPGYTLEIGGLYEQFSAGIPGDWTVENLSTDGGQPWIGFEGPDPCGQFPGNMTGGTGPYAIVNSNCDFFVTDDTNMITPSVDLSGTAEPILRFKSDYFDLDSTANASYSDDGGATWNTVYEKAGVDDRGPKTIEAALPTGADVRVRFHFDGFWAWWWQVDDVLLGEADCLPGTGGLVVGNVYDASTGNGLNGATVANLAGGSTKTFPTPDPVQNDGFYILYAEAGNNDFEASLALYSSDTDSVLVVPGASQRLDFSLLSGNLTASPSPLHSRVNPGGTDEQTLTLTNTGGADASFELVEINAPLLPSLTHGFASQSLRQAALARLPRNEKGTAESRQTSTRDLPAMPNRPAPGRVLAVGDVLSKFDSNITYGWGVATVGTNIWLANLGLAGGDDQDYEYTPDGTQTGNTIDDSGVGEWAADGAFNPLTGNFWRVAVGGDNCIYEFSPSTLSQTGNSICGSPWAGISQRGLAYDQAGDTYFIGGWNEGVIYHFDSDGNTIDSAFVGLPISGLAYNSANGHLLAISNQPAGQDITVLDALDNYNVIGSFQVLDDGSPAFGDFAQAGMEFDCIGNLWAINQFTQVVYQIESGEGAGCEVDIPWFSVDPAEGTIPGVGGARPTGGGNAFDVSASWDSAGLLPGLRLAQLIVKTDTPRQVPNIPVTLTVRFLDVPDSNQFEAYIYGAAGAGIMNGGPPNCPAGVLNFCPNGVVTRADMAGYIFRAVNGSQTPPPVYQNIFGDVTFNQYNSFYIQGIFDLGITAGCGNGNYCPDDANTRAQMSVFIWKGEHGEDPPPPCTGVFNDVACPGGFAVDYIEGLYNEGVTAGCGNNNFCPDANITNGQMSVFLVKAFNVPHL